MLPGQKSELTPGFKRLDPQMSPNVEFCCPDDGRAVLLIRGPTGMPGDTCIPGKGRHNRGVTTYRGPRVGHCGGVDDPRALGRCHAFAARHLGVVSAMLVSMPPSREMIGWTQGVGATTITADFVCLATRESDDGR